MSEAFAYEGRVHNLPLLEPAEQLEGLRVAGAVVGQLLRDALAAGCRAGTRKLHKTNKQRCCPLSLHKRLRVVDAAAHFCDEMLAHLVARLPLGQKALRLAQHLIIPCIMCFKLIANVVHVAILD